MDGGGHALAMEEAVAAMEQVSFILLCLLPPLRLNFDFW